MTGERDDEETMALLARLLGTAVDGVPSGVFGRVSRLAGTMARAGVAFGARRLGVKGARDEVTLERLVQSLGTLKGVAMKAGQILSYTDESLPEEARRILATLQTHSAHVPFDRLRSVVLDELGTKGQALLSTMHRHPVAAASIGQVHRATLPSGHEVAVKIQYPGIDTALSSDFRAAASGARFARLLAPAGNIEDFIAEARERILAECDYVQELALVADKRTMADLNLPGELLFLFRIRFGLHSVLARIGAEANWYQLERAWSDRG